MWDVQVHTRRVPSTRLAGHPARIGVSEPRSAGPGSRIWVGRGQGGDADCCF